jgi:hypothetical protein
MPLGLMDQRRKESLSGTMLQAAAIDQGAATSPIG